MKRSPVYWQKAKRILSKRDPVLRKIIKKYNKGFLATRNNPFYSLCRTVVGQQISTKAADSIWLKFEKKCKKRITPNIVLRISSRSLKGAGLSRQKISYLKNIAKAFKNKSFNVKELNKMNDNETIDVVYGTAVGVDDDAQGAVEELLVSAESGAVTIAGTPADNDLCYFRIFRDVSEGNDDMAADARLHGVKVFFTTDAANDA